MADYKQLYEQVCEQYDVLAKELEAIKQALAAQPAPVQPVDGTQVSKVWWDGEKLMVKPIPLEDIYQPVQEPWNPSDTAHRPGGLPQDFTKHEVDLADAWSEWVCPASAQYFMKCCDCGLVHEMQFKVAKYSEGDECEFVADADLQAVFRARRTTPPAAQPAPAQEPVFKPCSCRWKGEEQVQQCTLHAAHIEAIHEWAERAKTAEAKLKEKTNDRHQDQTHHTQGFQRH
jgi:hypothetical protein